MEEFKYSIKVFILALLVGVLFVAGAYINEVNKFASLFVFFVGYQVMHYYAVFYHINHKEDKDNKEK